MPAEPKAILEQLLERLGFEPGGFGGRDALRLDDGSLGKALGLVGFGLRQSRGLVYVSLRKTGLFGGGCRAIDYSASVRVWMRWLVDSTCSLKCSRSACTRFSGLANSSASASPAAPAGGS